MSPYKLLLILAIGGTFGCAQQQYKADDIATVRALPQGATNIKDVGNNWITFQWNNGGPKKCFLYHKEVDGINEYRIGFETMAPIDCE